MTYTSKAEFMKDITPHANKVGAELGIDPRLIIAQAIQETGWGKKVKGNNYFGIKSHGKKDGQTITTHEVINGKKVKIKDNFRSYDSLGESVRDYGNFLLTNPRYKKVLEAKNLPAQIAAMGNSGYATDPNYGTSLSNIVSGKTFTSNYYTGQAPETSLTPAEPSVMGKSRMDSNPALPYYTGTTANIPYNPEAEVVPPTNFPARNDFSSTFARARANAGGGGGTFVWQGKEYTTDYANEARPQVTQEVPQVRPQARPESFAQAVPQVRPRARPESFVQAVPQVRPQARAEVLQQGVNQALQDAAVNQAIQDNQARMYADGTSYAPNPEDILMSQPVTAAVPPVIPAQMADGGPLTLMQTDPATIAMASLMGMSVDDYISSMTPSAIEANLQRIARATANEGRVYDNVFSPQRPVYAQGVNPLDIEETYGQMRNNIQDQEVFDMGVNPSYATDVRDRAVGIGVSDRMATPSTSEGTRNLLPQTDLPLQAGADEMYVPTGAPIPTPDELPFVQRAKVLPMNAMELMMQQGIGGYGPSTRGGPAARKAEIPPVMPTDVGDMDAFGTGNIFTNAKPQPVVPEGEPFVGSVDPRMNDYGVTLSGEPVKQPMSQERAMQIFQNPNATEEELSDARKAFGYEEPQVAPPVTPMQADEDTAMAQPVPQVAQVDPETPDNKGVDPRENMTEEQVEVAAINASEGVAPEIKESLFKKFADIFGLETKDLTRALGYYLMSRATGASHAGSMKWAGVTVLKQAESRDTLANETKAEKAKMEAAAKVLLASGYTPASVASYTATGIASVLDKPGPDYTNKQLKDKYAELLAAGKFTDKSLQASFSTVPGQFNPGFLVLKGGNGKTNAENSQLLIKDLKANFDAMVDAAFEDKEQGAIFKSDMMTSAETYWVSSGIPIGDEAVGSHIKRVTTLAMQAAMADSKKNGTTVKDITPYIKNMSLDEYAQSGTDSIWSIGSTGKVDAAKVAVLREDMYSKSGADTEVMKGAFLAAVDEFNNLSPSQLARLKPAKGENKFYVYLREKLAGL